MHLFSVLVSFYTHIFTLPPLSRLISFLPVLIFFLLSLSFHSYILLSFLILNHVLASQLDLYLLRYGGIRPALASGLPVKPVCQFTDLCQITMPYVSAQLEGKVRVVLIREWSQGPH